MANIVKQLGSPLAGAGAGLAEQLPKEIAQYRLSSGLQNLAENAHNMTPYQQIAGFYGIPGVTPEMVRQLTPYLQQQNIANGPVYGDKSNSISSQGNFNPQHFENQSQSQSQPQTTLPPQQNLPADKENYKSLATREGAQALITPMIPPSPDAIEVDTRNRMNSNDPKYKGENAYAHAREDAEKALNYPNKVQEANIAAEERRKNLQKRIGTELDDKLMNFLQKPTLNNLNEVVPSKIRELARQKIEVDILNGESDSEAINKQVQDLEPKVKAANSLKNNIGKRSFFSPASKDLKESLKTLAPTFKTENEKEWFKDMAITSLDIGDHLSSAQVFPPQKDLQNALINSSVSDDPDKIAASLYNKFSPLDSIFATGYLLKKLGIDDVKVMSKLKQMQQGGLFQPNERQTRELAEYYPSQGNVRDLFYLAVFGPVLPLLLEFGASEFSGKKEKLSLMENIKRIFGGKE